MKNILLLKNGIKKLMSGSLPAKVDTGRQHAFYDGALRPLMDRAEKSELSLLFLDAPHFVMGCDFLGYIYGMARRFVLTFSRRKCCNVLGAIDYVTKKVLRITNLRNLPAKD